MIVVEMEVKYGLSIDKLWPASVYIEGYHDLQRRRLRSEYVVVHLNNLKGLWKNFAHCMLLDIYENYVKWMCDYRFYQNVYFTIMDIVRCVMWEFYKTMGCLDEEFYLLVRDHL